MVFEIRYSWALCLPLCFPEALAWEEGSYHDTHNPMEGATGYETGGLLPAAM